MQHLRLISNKRFETSKERLMHPGLVLVVGIGRFLWGFTGVTLNLDVWVTSFKVLFNSYSFIDMHYM
jgi:hypothetical protein